MKRNFNAPKYFRAVFRQTMAQYEAARSQKTGSAVPPYAVSGDDHASTPRVPLPSPLDFCADVELSAKSVLTQDEYSFFIQYYAWQNWEYAEKMLKLDQEKLRAVKRDVQFRVGRAFVSRSVSPAQRYLHAPSKVLGIGKCHCSNKAGHSAAKDSDLWCKGGCGLNMAYHEPSYWIVAADRLALWCYACNKKREEEDAAAA